MVVDDDSLRFTFTTILEDEDFEVTAASDGLEGVEMATKHRFDLILLTALATQALIDQALEEGAFAVHHKPFDVRKLTYLVRIVMRSTCVLVVDDQPETRTAMHAIPEDSATRYPKLRTGTKRFPRLEKPTSTSYSWMLSCQVWTDLPPARRSSKKPGCKNNLSDGAHGCQLGQPSFVHREVFFTYQTS